jgi:hypothetical protein
MSVVVAEGMGVAEGMRVCVGVGEMAAMAVTVRTADVLIDDRMGDKVGSGLSAPKLHPLSKRITVIINKKKYFLTRMTASIFK